MYTGRNSFHIFLNYFSGNEIPLYVFSVVLFAELKALPLQLSGKIKWRRRLCKIFYFRSFQCRRVQNKLCVIGAEKQNSASVKNAQAFIY